MQVVRNIRDIPASVPSVVTIGTFDGVHLGHGRILSAVREVAGGRGLRSVLITFDPHPREVLGTNGQALFLLNTIQERIELLSLEQIDVCVVIPFTRHLSLLSAEEFFDQVIASIGARHVVVGFDHKFGKGRGGDTAELERIAAARGIDTTVVPALLIDGRKVSSTVIRHALYEGDVRSARAFLGRPFSLRGIILRGAGLGRTLGYPTANIHIDVQRKILPRFGVYVARMHLPGMTVGGVMNIGVKPTVGDGGGVSLEMFLLDFDRDIYGAEVRVEILERLRDEQKFESLDALAVRIGCDAEAAREFLRRNELQTTHS